MGEQTTIEWTHHTFNPWIGCTKVHTGCKGCYAEAQNAHRKWNGGEWGAGAQRKVTSNANWKKPVAWARAAAQGGERRRVFCASLADVLDEEAPADAQARLWDLIRETAACTFVRNDDGREVLARILEPKRVTGAPGLDWLLLTKRPERWRLIPEDVRPLVWFGTSISDQPTADEWGRRVANAECFRLRFLSVEPMVGPIVLRDEVLQAVQWVICGGESGAGARQYNLAWPRSIIAQCRAAGVPVFHKQVGAVAIGETESDHRHPHNHGRFFSDPLRLTLADAKGGNPSEWPEDLRVPEFPKGLLR